MHARIGVGMQKRALCRGRHTRSGETPAAVRGLNSAGTARNVPPSVAARRNYTRAGPRGWWPSYSYVRTGSGQKRIGEEFQGRLIERSRPARSGRVGLKRRRRMTGRRRGPLPVSVAGTAARERRTGGPYGATVSQTDVSSAATLSAKSVPPSLRMDRSGGRPRSVPFLMLLWRDDTS
jgi:hypothetical protein